MTPETQLSVRHASTQDVPRVVGLIEENGLAQDQEPGYVESKLTGSDRDILVAEEAGSIVGTIVIQRAHPPFYGINYLTATEGYRGDGVEEALLTQAEKEISERKGTRIITIIGAGELQLVDLFRRHGFEKQIGEPVEMRKDF